MSHAWGARVWLQRLPLHLPLRVDAAAHLGQVDVAVVHVGPLRGGEELVVKIGVHPAVDVQQHVPKRVYLLDRVHVAKNAKFEPARVTEGIITIESQRFWGGL